MNILQLLSPALIMLCLGCTTPAQQPAVDVAAEEAAIRAADAQWLAAAKAQDLEKTLPFWSEDATILMPNTPPIKGQEAIRRYVADSFASPDFAITWTTDQISVARSGDMAYSTGTDRITYRGPKNQLITETNNGIVIWKKQATGDWKVVVDIATAAPSAR